MYYDSFCSVVQRYLLCGEPFLTDYTFSLQSIVCKYIGTDSKADTSSYTTADSKAVTKTDPKAVTKTGAGTNTSANFSAT